MSLLRLHRKGIDLAIELPTDVTKDVAVIEEGNMVEIRQVAATRAGQRRFVIGSLADHVTREPVA